MRKPLCGWKLDTGQVRQVAIHLLSGLGPASSVAKVHLISVCRECPCLCFPEHFRGLYVCGQSLIEDFPKLYIFLQHLDIK